MDARPLPHVQVLGSGALPSTIHSFLIWSMGEFPWFCFPNPTVPWFVTFFPPPFFHSQASLEGNEVGTGGLSGRRLSRES